MDPNAGPSRLQFAPLPFSLDTSCPVALPAKQHTGPQGLSIMWVMHSVRSDSSGPIASPTENHVAFIRRRYLETLFLSDVSRTVSHH